MDNKRQLVAKSIYKEMDGYKTWTEVNEFMACGLQGVMIKIKVNLRDIKKN